MNFMNLLFHLSVHLGWNFIIKIFIQKIWYLKTWFRYNTLHIPFIHIISRYLITWFLHNTEHICLISIRSKFKLWYSMWCFSLYLKNGKVSYNDGTNYNHIKRRSSALTILITSNVCQMLTTTLNRNNFTLIFESRIPLNYKFPSLFLIFFN